MMFIALLLIILIGAGIGRIISAKIKQPAVLGEIIVGMIIGNIYLVARTEPFLRLIKWLSNYNVNISGITNPIAITEPISYIADIGILLLIFSTGLTIDFEEFKRLELASTIVAFSGVVVRFILGYWAACLVKNEIRTPSPSSLFPSLPPYPRQT